MNTPSGAWKSILIIIAVIGAVILIGVLFMLIIDGNLLT
jgi:hypothetical protein